MPPKVFDLLSDTKHRIGVMQGRLSPMIDGRIQAFPWPYWKEEFKVAEQLGIDLIEWTLDQDKQRLLKRSKILY